jgi:NADPH2:quinone reductase
MIKQHGLHCEIAAMADSGSLRTTLGENPGPINAANLKKAHENVESGRTRGKIFLAGF